MQIASLFQRLPPRIGLFSGSNQCVPGGSSSVFAKMSTSPHRHGPVSHLSGGHDQTVQKLIPNNFPCVAHDQKVLL
jgi:hypothetical protein